jgi:hypothetical protein
MTDETLRGDLEIARLRLQAAHAEAELLRTAIRRLADQDATLSVCNGNVTVTMDGTLTDAEREAIEAAARIVDEYEEEMDGFPSGAAATLRRLLERLG